MAIYELISTLKTIIQSLQEKKKEDSEKGDKYEAELCKRWDKKLFWRIPIQRMNNIKVIWELLKTSIYWKKGNAFKTEQKEVVLHVLLVASEAEARKPVTLISEEGYYLRPEPALRQLLSLLSVGTSSLLSSLSSVLIWNYSSPGWTARHGKDRLTLHEMQAECYKRHLRDSKKKRSKLSFHPTITNSSL